MAIVNYSINGYCWLFYLKLFKIILLMAIGGYSIGAYWWLFY
jgi:hypothetical protein